jgi:hypothetical protein
MKDFIKIQEKRIRKNTIKSYSPFGDSRINIYFNVSRYKIELETFDFKNEQKRNSQLELLDLEFGL